MRAVTRSGLIGKRQAEMAKKNTVINMEVLSTYLQSVSDSDMAQGTAVSSQSYEIPSVMVLSVAGTDHEDPQSLSYRACTKCHFKKTEKDGTCSKCGGN